MLKKILSFLTKPIYLILKTYWFIFRPKTFGVKVFLRCNNEILLVKNPYGTKKWNLPGGAIRRKETPEAAAKREVEEELGIKINKLKKLGSFLTTREYKRDTVDVFESWLNQTPEINKDFEIKEAKWFEINNLPVSNGSILEKSLKFLKTQ